MRIEREIALCLLAGSLLAACSPMDDSWWTNNEVVDVDWTQANLETGRKPAGLGDCTVFYYPQVGDVPFYDYELPDEKGEADVKEGVYDILVTGQSEFITGTEMYRTSMISIPVQSDVAGERIITKNPEEMIYAGMLENVKVREDAQSIRQVVMKRLLKKMTVVVNVTDRAELDGNVDIELSGLATEKKINNAKVEGLPAVLKFPISKYGSTSDTGNGIQTAFCGYVYLLGVNGDNILCLSFEDEEGKERKFSLNLTPYQHYWSTEEVTVTVEVDAIAGTITAGKWSEGPVDIPIDI